MAIKYLWFKKGLNLQLFTKTVKINVSCLNSAKLISESVCF